MNLNFDDIDNDNEEFTYYSRRRRKMNKILLILLLIGVPVMLKIAQKNTPVPPEKEAQNTSQAESVPEQTASVSGEEVKPTPPPEKEPDFWNLILVNRENSLPQDFTVELADIGGGEKIDTRIEPMLQQMIQEAVGAGAVLTVCSGYRSYDLQDTLFAREKGSYEDRGYSEDECYALAGKYVQPPGSSEHETGLAVDFLTDEWRTLNTGFANTTAYRWLKEHAAEYGFIERYPEGKEEITGVSWEPWHYRYVGIETAEDILRSGLTLEEYVTNFWKEYRSSQTVSSKK